MKEPLYDDPEEMTDDDIDYVKDPIASFHFNEELGVVVELDGENGNKALIVFTHEASVNSIIGHVERVPGLLDLLKERGFDGACKHVGLAVLGEETPEQQFYLPDDWTD